MFSNSNRHCRLSQLHRTRIVLSRPEKIQICGCMALCIDYENKTTVQDLPQSKNKKQMLNYAITPLDRWNETIHHRVSE